MQGLAGRARGGSPANAVHGTPYTICRVHTVNQAGNIMNPAGNVALHFPLRTAADWLKWEIRTVAWDKQKPIIHTHVVSGIDPYMGHVCGECEGSQSVAANV